MVETATKTTTPRRPRSATTKTPAAKPAATKAPAKTPAKAATAEPETVAVTFSLASSGETKNYATFDLSTNVDGNATGCVGKVYAPLGTETVKVRIEGPADAIEAE